MNDQIEILNNDWLPIEFNGVTKADVVRLKERTKAKVLETGNPLHLAETIKGIEEFVKLLKEDSQLKDYTLEEIGKYKGGYTSTSGAKIELCEAGHKYDYTNDAEWVRLYKELKARETVLKSIPAGKTLVDDTGEVIAVGANKTSVSTYKITLK